MAQNGAAMKLPTSTTRTPSSARSLIAPSWVVNEPAPCSIALPSQPRVSPDPRVLDAATAALYDFFSRAVSPELAQLFGSQAYRDKVKANPVVPKEKAALDVAMRNLKTLHDAGVQIALGTDSGALPERIPGWAEHHELELMVRSGLTPMDAIVAATRQGARLLKASDRGTLEVGKRADFIVLAADPVADIRNTRKLLSVWHGGREVEPRVRAIDAPRAP